VIRQKLGGSTSRPWCESTRFAQRRNSGILGLAAAAATPMRAAKLTKNECEPPHQSLAYEEATMVVHADNVLRTEPIETADSPDDDDDDSAGVPVPMSAEVSAQWNSWFENALEHHLIEGAAGLTVMRAVGLALDDRIGPLERQAKQIDQLKLEVARLRGAVDVLRGRGVPGMPRVRGTHDPGTGYTLHDVVAHNGGSFVALKDGPGACPGPDWQQVAARGGRGQRGWQGPQGERGTNAPVWSSVSFNPKTFALETRMSDGSLGPVLRLDHVFADISAEFGDAQ
jgi:hypothetical protein